MILPEEKDYPKELLIGNETYKIRFVKVIRGHGPNVVGLCDDGRKLITLKRGQGKKELFSTFAHELCHAFEAEYGIKINHKEIYKLETAVVELFIKNS